MFGMIYNIVVDMCATWKMVPSNSKLLHVWNIESASVVCRRSASVRDGLRWIDLLRLLRIGLLSLLRIGLLSLWRIGLLRLWRVSLLRLWRILLVRLLRIGLLRLKGYIFLVL